MPADISMRDNFVTRMEDFTERYKDKICLLYTSDAADERSSVDLGGRRILKKKINKKKKKHKYQLKWNTINETQKDKY